VRLLRHFLAVSIVIGLVVAVGFVWSTSDAASIVADDNGGGSRPSPAQPGTSPAARRELDQRGASGFSLSNISDLAQTLLILTLITAAVVVIDGTRRRYRPRRFPTRSAGTGV
jgi:hypothetical protein